ncbi:MAM and LDL-receptor class A domain-containing protein 1-like [Antedon mediterranea]|uniref:MAM and LDL-receptor class A domain-containing protein 1-like n=1 Tax=Antedon mediterranea TaxID=105859 RepID=UPI003AF4908B
MDCTFEKDLCGWYQDSNDEFDWTRTNSQTPSTTTGPGFDHTLGNGYYLYIETSSPTLPGYRARLISHPQVGYKNNNKQGCFSFWYHMFGLSIDTLNVYLKQASVETRLWTRYQTQGNQWLKAELTIVSTKKSWQTNNDTFVWQIVFEAIRGDTFTGDIAIDDTFLEEGPCQPTKECNFETGFCSWTQDDTDDFDWSIGNNGTASLGTGPQIDHTMGTETGMFAYIETSSPRVKGDIARIVSPVFDDTFGECMRFWFHMYGSGIGSLRVRALDTITNVYTDFFEVNSYNDNAWRFAQTTIKVGHAYNVVIEGEVGSNYQGDIAVDDVSIVPGTCGRRGFCDFEIDKCGWINEPTLDSFDWLRNAGSTPSAYTGPTIDHTSGTSFGYYMFVEMSSGNLGVGSNAMFVSEHLPSTNDACLYFWYHMYGQGTGDLNVYIKDDQGNMRIIWTLFGDQGDKWFQGISNLVSSTEFQIVFEATYGTTYTGDIALDDIDIEAVGCPGQGIQTTLAPALPMNCQFETGLCNYKQLNDDEFNWTRNKGSTSSTDTGPSTDHTLGTGYYIYVEASSPRVAGDRARIMTPKQNPTTAITMCVQFWYHMYGPHVDRLNVYLRSGSNDQLVFTKFGTQGNVWHKAEKSIDSDDMWSLIFEGKIGVSYAGDIAIDDVAQFTGPCTAIRECDFELDFCEWTQEKSDDFDWSRGKGGTPSAGTGPTVDHSTGTSAGRCKVSYLCKFLYTYSLSRHNNVVITRDGLTLFNTNNGAFIIDMACSQHNKTAHTLYIQMEPLTCPNYPQGLFFCLGIPPFDIRYFGYIETSSPRVAGDIARILSPTYPDTQGECLQMWYHMYGSGIGTMTVYSKDLVTNIESAPLWTKSGDLNDQWRFTQISVSAAHQYQIIIEGVVGSNYQGDIAIDDVEITTGSCGRPGFCDFESDMCAWTNDNFDDWDWLRANGNTPSSYTGPTTDHTTNSDQAPGIFDCTFEANICSNWKQDKSTDNFDWTRQRGSTSSVDTGPGFDHTTLSPNGYYIYIETSGQTNNQKARLISVNIDTASYGMCVTWWYHMYGANINKLNIYRKDANTNALDLEWQRQGNQGFQWKYAQVFMNGSFAVVFEGVVGTSYQGDISVDDIYLTDGDCPSPAICDFEHGNDVCGYSQDKKDNFDWTLASGSTGSSGTGPSNDHTYGTSAGHYMYIESSSPRTFGDKALIRSLEYPSTYGQCLRFWYHMTGDNMGALKVYAEMLGDKGTAIWSRTFASPDFWRLTEVSVVAQYPYRIVFEGIVGNGWSGDIAIDDIYIKNGICNQPGTCDFETDMCTYFNVPFDDFDWLRNSGATGSVTTGPTNDHTLGTPFGEICCIAPTKT